MTSGFSSADQLPSLATTSALPAPVDAPSRFIDTEYGQVTVYEKGEGTPIIFVHSFNAAGSAVELRPLFERFAENHRVITFDWLGFGRSARPAIEYSPAVYQAILRTVMDQVTLESLDVVALSLPGQYVVRLANEEPDRFRRIALISPTGFGRFGGGGSQRFLCVLRDTPAGAILFRLLRTGPVLDYFQRKLFVDKAHIPAGYRRYNWLTTREPGAKNAPIYFVAGMLKDPHAPAAYERVAVPTLMLFGDRSSFADPMAGQRLAECNVMLKVVTFSDTGDLPQIERPGATYQVIAGFLDDEPKPVTRSRRSRATESD